MFDDVINTASELCNVVGLTAFGSYFDARIASQRKFVAASQTLSVSDTDKGRRREQRKAKS